MATIWKSTNQKYPNRPTNNAISGAILSSWSRQQKLAMIAGFAILGLLLVMSACSKESPKPVLVSVSNPASSPVPTSAMPATTIPVTTSAVPATAAAIKKTAKTKTRPANVSYSDANSGVSFLYPRKFMLTSGDKAQPQLPAVGDVPMNFVQPGGAAIATVALPTSSYPGTDFEAAFFNVNINRSVSEQECGHFAFVDTRDADGEPVDAERVKVGSAEMEMTSDFSAGMMKQAETEYYHSYENGACYEYVLGLGTGGYGAKDGIKPVDRDEVFAKLEKILVTVKVNAKGDVNGKTNPLEAERPAEAAAPIIASGKDKP